MSRDDLPTFFIVGAMKAGTTSLARYLAQHRDVYMSDPKEPRFFMEAGTWSNGVDWYRSLFAGGADRPARGEATTGYTKLPVHQGVPERISKLVPDAKIVYLVRDPLPRIRSQYVHEVVHSGLRAPLRDAIEADPRYLWFSKYAFQIDPYRRIFGDERVLVLASEELRADRTTAVNRVLRFVGVEPVAHELDLTAEANRGDRKRDRLRDRSLAARGVRWLARTPPARLMPARMRRLGHALTTRPLVDPDDLALSPEAEARVLDELAEDHAALEQMAPDVTRRWYGPD